MADRFLRRGFTVFWVAAVAKVVLCFTEKVIGMSGPTPNPFRYGPTRGELWFWLVVSVGGLALMVYVFGVRGMPGGPALIELVGLPALLFCYLGGRSVKRLIKAEHP